MVKRLIHLVLFAALIFTLYPIVYTLSMSMSGADEIRLGLVYLYPKGITLETYKLIISSGDMWKAYGNSILISAGVVMVALIITMPAAYALSVKTFFIKAALTKYFMVTLFFGGGIIPLFLLIIKNKQLN
jgi:putative aldouronate transport system permease protein